jgi:hypothetical protein
MYRHYQYYYPGLTAYFPVFKFPVPGRIRETNIPTAQHQWKRLVTEEVFMIDQSAISVAVNVLRAHLTTYWPELAGSTQNPLQIVIGHPAAAAKQADQSDGTQSVNIFVYRIDHGGYPSKRAKNDQLYVKLHCLLTAFAKQENSVSAGEMDLRIIGRIIMGLNENPILSLPEDATAASQNTIARLQIVPEQISVDEMNKIWSTQSETSYRPSVGYELTLIPIPIKERPRPGKGVV